MNVFKSQGTREGRREEFLTLQEDGSLLHTVGKIMLYNVSLLYHGVGVLNFHGATFCGNQIVVRSLYEQTQWSLGYNDFDFFDKMEPPRRHIDVKWDSIGHIYKLLF
jgi:hypothetical protein